jgi:uncharacterized alkaline shock family protein YloU
MGKINISDQYIMDIIEKNVSGCFGIAGFGCKTPAEKLYSGLTGKKRNSGISINISDNKLTVNIHISVTYGTNIQAVAASIRNKLRFALSEAAGIETESVNIFVDDIVS